MWYLLVLLVAMLSIAKGQGIDIRGVVSDSTTGEKLPYTNVIIMGTSKGAATNIEGFYLIPNNDIGMYQVAASAVGYERKIKTVRVGREGPVIVNFELAPVVVELEEVVVTETGKRELLEINTSVHLLDEKDIKTVPVTVLEDIFRSITVLPGVVSTSDVNSHFYVRGGGGDQNLILLDGVKIYNPFHAFGVFSIFDADIIRSTEVYTGGFPPGYGGRLSSVVSMTTRDGKTTGVGGMANINFLSSKLLLEGPVFGNFQWIVSGRKTVFPKTFSKFFGQDVPLDFYDAFFKFSRQTGGESRFSVQGFFSGDDLKSPDITEPDYRWRSRAIGLTASGLIQDRLFVRVVGFDNSFEAERIAKASPTATPASSRIHEVNVRADATAYTSSRDLYFFGFEFNFPQLEYRLHNSFGIERTIKSTLVETWLWLRYQAIFEDLKIDVGVHVDVASAFERNNSTSLIQPRLNVSYALADSWLLKGSYGRFSQNMITVNNEDDVISLFDAWIQIPSELNSEQADHFVLGIDGNPTRELSVGLQGYYKNFIDLVAYNRDKIDATDPDYINGKGRAYGMEALVRYGIPYVDVYTAYTLGWTTITANRFTYPPGYDRRHNLDIMTVFHPMSSLDITLRWEYGSGLPYTQSVGYYDRLNLGNIFDGGWVDETGDPYSILGEKNAARLPAYHRLDLSLAYRFGIGPARATAGINIINVYDRKNILYFDRQTGQQTNMLPFFPTASLTVEY